MGVIVSPGMSDLAFLGSPEGALFNWFVKMSEPPPFFRYFISEVLQFTRRTHVTILLGISGKQGCISNVLSGL